MKDHSQKLKEENLIKEYKSQKYAQALESSKELQHFLIDNNFEVSHVDKDTDGFNRHIYFINWHAEIFVGLRLETGKGDEWFYYYTVGTMARRFIPIETSYKNHTKELERTIKKYLDAPRTY